jgi:hypothetical protein
MATSLTGPASAAADEGDLDRIAFTGKGPDVDRIGQRCPGQHAGRLPQKVTTGSRKLSTVTLRTHRTLLSGFMIYD